MDNIEPILTNTVALSDVVRVAFKHQKSTSEMIAAVTTAYTEGFGYKDLQQSFYIGQIAGVLNPKASTATPYMVKEATRILDLKNYSAAIAGKSDSSEYRTKDQQRIYTNLRKAWQRIAAAAGVDVGMFETRGGDQTGGKPVKSKSIPFRKYAPPIAETADEVIEFTLDLADLLRKYVETNSNIIPLELRPIFATFLNGMAFATSSTAKRSLTVVA